MRFLILALCIVLAACGQEQTAADSTTSVVTETVTAGTDSFQTTETAPLTATTPPMPSVDSVQRIRLQDAIAMLDRGEAVLVDVRGPAAYAAQHARGAIEISESEIVNRVADIPMGKMIITYCT